MQITSLETAKIIEEAECLHAAQQISACAKLFPSSNIHTTPIGSGLASLSLPIFGRKLNHIVGLGMSGPVTPDILRDVEALYASADLDVVVDLCPLADATILEILGTEGYKTNGFINNDGLDLGGIEIPTPKNPKVTIREIAADMQGTFVDLSVKGFSTNGRSQFLLKTVAETAAMRTDTRLYVAFVDGQPAGSAGLALIETSMGMVAHLYIDSTLPESRGCGIQGSLVEARLVDARASGCKLALLSARPGTASARNAERAGFRLAYTKSTFLKAVPTVKVA